VANSHIRTGGGNLFATTRARRYGGNEGMARENRNIYEKWDLAKCKTVGNHIFYDFAILFGTLQILLNAKLKMHNPWR